MFAKTRRKGKKAAKSKKSLKDLFLAINPARAFEMWVLSYVEYVTLKKINLYCESHAMCSLCNNVKLRFWFSVHVSCLNVWTVQLRARFFKRNREAFVSWGWLKVMSSFIYLDGKKCFAAESFFLKFEFKVRLEILFTKVNKKAVTKFCFTLIWTNMLDDFLYQLLVLRFFTGIGSVFLYNMNLYDLK